MRELKQNEIEATSGGIAPLIGLAIGVGLGLVFGGSEESTQSEQVETCSTDDAIN